MLKRFDDSMLLKEIRGSDGRWFISLDGQVFEYGKGIASERLLDGDSVIYCKFLGKLDWHRLYDLIAVHFKYMEHLSDEEVSNVRGFYAPSKRGYEKGHGKHHPYHVGYRFKDGRLEVKGKSGFYYIPGFMHRGIDADYNLICTLTMSAIAWWVTQPQDRNITGGYYVNSSSRNGHKYTLSRHRSMIMVFGDPYPDNCDLLIVNHVNGIPGYDRIDNLEWLCRKGNINHAYQSGLRSQNKPVLARNIFTGEVTEYYSVAECGRQLGILDKTLNYRLERLGFSTVGRSGHQFKYTDDPRDWIVPEDPHAALQKAMQSIKVIARCGKTGNVFEFDNSGMASKFTGIKDATIKWRYKNGMYQVKDGWQFKRSDDPTPFPDIDILWHRKQHQNV